MNINKGVIDTSIVIKWFASKDEKNLDEALKLLEDIKRNRFQPIVCEFLYYEVANALYWGKKLEKSNFEEGLNTLLSIPFIIHPFNKEVVGSVYSTMDKYKLTLYDSFPLVVARIENCPLLSADEKHHRGLPNVIFFKNYK